MKLVSLLEVIKWHEEIITRYKRALADDPNDQFYINALERSRNAIQDIRAEIRRIILLKLDEVCSLNMHNWKLKEFEHSHSTLLACFLETCLQILKQEINEKGKS